MIYIHSFLFYKSSLTLLQSERPKLNRVMAILSAKGLITKAADYDYQCFAITKDFAI